MIATIEIENYDAQSVVRAMGREAYEEMRLALADAFDVSEWEEGKDSPPYFYLNKTTVDLEEVGPILSKYRIPFKIKRMKGTYFPGPHPVTGVIQHHTQISIPNVGLLAIDEVSWMEDACTEALQKQLDEGWRIIAVCPPCDVRRPTYILGRTKRG